MFSWDIDAYENALNLTPVINIEVRIKVVQKMLGDTHMFPH